MKPKQLKYPFNFEERCVHVMDRVWYVPVYYDRYEEFNFPGWQAPEFFGNDQPVRVEYCSGNGAWIVDWAKREPNINWVAVEMQFDRVRKIWSKIKNENLKNLMVVCGQAQTVTKHYFLDESIDAVYINFPDPWPKDRHAKHRLIQAPFVEQMGRCLRHGGQVTLTTDDATYSEQMVLEMCGSKTFRSLYPKPFYVHAFPDYGARSFFEDLWREKGKQIHYHCFEKGDGSCAF